MEYCNTVANLFKIIRQASQCTSSNFCELQKAKNWFHFQHLPERSTFTDSLSYLVLFIESQLHSVIYIQNATIASQFRQYSIFEYTTNSTGYGEAFPSQLKLTWGHNRKNVPQAVATPSHGGFKRKIGYGGSKRKIEYGGSIHWYIFQNSLVPVVLMRIIAYFCKQSMHATYYIFWCSLKYGPCH